MRSVRLLLGFLALLPLQASARTLPVTFGTTKNVEQILSSLINYMAGALIFIATAMFTVGAFYIVISRGEPDQVSKGKNLMIGSLIGAAVVLGSYSILRTVFFFIYA